MHDMYIIEIYRPGPICLTLIVWVHLHSLLHSELRKSYMALRYGRSRLLKPVPIANHIRLLLVFHCNAYLLSFQSYNDIVVENQRLPPFAPTAVSFEVLSMGFLTSCPNKKLTYRKQITLQLRRQYVEGIHSNSTVTLKSRLGATECHWMEMALLDRSYNLQLVELFDVEYYRDL